MDAAHCEGGEVVGVYLGRGHHQDVGLRVLQHPDDERGGDSALADASEGFHDETLGTVLNVMSDIELHWRGESALTERYTRGMLQPCTRE